MDILVAGAWPALLARSSSLPSEDCEELIGKLKSNFFSINPMKCKSRCFATKNESDNVIIGKRSLLIKSDTSWKQPGGFFPTILMRHFCQQSVQWLWIRRKSKRKVKVKSALELLRKKRWRSDSSLEAGLADPSNYSSCVLSTIAGAANLKGRTQLLLNELGVIVSVNRSSVH